MRDFSDRLLVGDRPGMRQLNSLFGERIEPLSLSGEPQKTRISRRIDVLGPFLFKHQKERAMVAVAPPGSPRFMIE